MSLLDEITAFGLPHGQVWFRGQADASWSLLPRVLRSPRGISQEQNVLARFRTHAMGMITQYPSDTDPARWMFLIQHHGLPTRLLDRTESALAALYFAVDGHDDKDGCVYMLVPARLNTEFATQTGIFTPGMKEVRELLHACFSGAEKPQTILAMLAYASNDRIARQQEHFTAHGMDTDLPSMAKPHWLKTLPITGAAKPQIRQQLAWFGVTRSSLFYDLDSFAIQIRQEHGIS